MNNKIVVGGVESLPVSEVVQMLGVSRQRVWQLIESGILWGFYIGGRFFVVVEGVEARLAAQRGGKL